ncbi:MAG: hypothetical protein KJ072_09505 [Verrucomicrobia bacterium]|nr:hypothetical protein [Verrucomicrobiota bacterium]
MNPSDDPQEVRLFCGVLGILLFSIPLGRVLAADQEGGGAMCSWFRVENAVAGNGIAVGRPKVFDNRSLVLMLEQLDATLARVTVVDQVKMAQNIGLLQGMQQKDISRAVSLSTLPLPGTVLTEQRDTNTGQFVAQQRVTSNATVPPSAPTLAADLPAMSPSGYGIAAQDILSEEINLTYQILNLRMLLERSITDRTYTDTRTKNSGPRAQAVLGFQVSLDPMKQHKRCAAIVEIELAPAASSKKPPSMVAMMPLAKTYNVAALTRKANEFAVSAVLKVITVGYSERHTGQTYYLYRDTDTVAFERPGNQAQAQDQKLVFGWEFRPVLNRTAVEPGVRQLFAVVALDEQDLLELGTPDDFAMKVTVRTYWAKFDKKNAVISSKPRDERKDAEHELRIPRAQIVQKSLGPRVKKVEWKPCGEGTVLIDVSGDNFYNGTTAVVGGQILDRSSPSLLVKSDQFLQLTARTYDVGRGSIYLSGRYGLSEELLDDATRSDPKAMPDRFNPVVTFDPIAIKTNNELSIKLFPKDMNAPAPDLKLNKAIVTVGQQASVLEPTSWHKSTDDKFLETFITVPAEPLKSDTVVTVAIPFLGSEYQEGALLFKPITVDRAILIRDEDPQVWGILGTGFDEAVTTNQQTVVTADREYRINDGLDFKGRNLLTIAVPKAKAANLKNIIVKLGDSLPVVLAAPSASPPSAKVMLNNDPVPTANVGTAPVIEFAGENLGQVGKVRFASDGLDYSAEDGGKKLRVFINRKVTEKVGRVSLTVEAKDGSILAADVDVRKEEESK